MSHMTSSGKRKSQVLCVRNEVRNSERKDDDNDNDDERDQIRVERGATSHKPYRIRYNSQVASAMIPRKSSRSIGKFKDLGLEGEAKKENGVLPQDNVS